MAPMRDFLMDDTGDIALVNGDLVPVSDVAAIKQHVTIRLRVLLGEWFLDSSAGVPWFQQILGKKNSNLGAIQNQLQTVIAGTPGITSVLSVSLALDAASRSGTVSWAAMADATKISDSVQVPST